MRSSFLFSALSLTLFASACSELLKDHSSKQQEVQQPCTARYAPVANNPDIALDTQTGMLCRTIADTNDPLGIRDPGCAVTAQDKKVGFVPDACKSGQTWVKGEGDKNRSPYSNLPTCGPPTHIYDPESGTVKPIGQQ